MENVIKYIRNSLDSIGFADYVCIGIKNWSSGIQTTLVVCSHFGKKFEVSFREVIVLVEGDEAAIKEGSEVISTKYDKFQEINHREDKKEVLEYLTPKE